MYKLILENSKGRQLVFNQMGGPYHITDIDGLNPPDATINTSEAALMDGAHFNSSKVQMRQLEIAFSIEQPAEQNRIAAFDVIKSKQYIKVLYSNQMRNVYIEGYVHSFKVAYFDMKQIGTISILCPSPYWRDTQEMVNEMSAIVDGFHFPFMSTAEPELVMGYIDALVNTEVDNGGDVATGLVIEIYAYSPCSDPKVIDYLTGEYIGLDIDLEAGDLVTISTMSGSKTATLLRDGVITNVFNSIMQGSKWLQLDYSGGVYTYELGGGLVTNAAFYIKHQNIYEGV